MSAETLQRRATQEDPTDLMTIRELCLKWGYEYSYLYKWSIIKGAIAVYYRGTWKLSEGEVLGFTRQQAAAKLNKIRNTKEANDSGWYK